MRILSILARTAFAEGVCGELRVRGHDVIVSLAWAANALGRMGRSLRAGDIVLTGSISKVLRPTAGQSVRASFTRLGSVACRFV